MREETQASEYIEHHYSFLDRLKAPFAKFIRTSDDRVIISHARLNVVLSDDCQADPLVDKKLYNIDFEILVLTSSKDYEFTPKAIKKLMVAAEEALAPELNELNIYFYYHLLEFPTPEDINTLKRWLNQPRSAPHSQVTTDTIEYLIEVMDDPAYQHSFNYQKQHHAAIYNSLSFITFQNLNFSLPHGVGFHDIFGKDDKIRLFFNHFRSRHADFMAKWDIQKLRTSVRGTAHNIDFLDLSTSDKTKLYNCVLNTQLIKEVMAEPHPLQQKILLLKLLNRQLAAFESHLSATVQLAQQICKLAEGFQNFGLSVYSVGSVLNDAQIRRLCSHNWLEFRRIELLRIMPYTNSVHDSCANQLWLLTNLMGDTKTMVTQLTHALDALTVEPDALKPPEPGSALRLSGLTLQPDLKPAEVLPAASSDKQITATIFNRTTNYNKEMRARLRELNRQDRSEQAEPVRHNALVISADTQNLPDIQVTFADDTSLRFNLDTLTDSTGTNRLTAVLSNLSERKSFVCDHGLIELTPEAKAALRAADNRSLLRTNGQSANGIKLSPIYNVLALKRAGCDERVLFHYLSVTINPMSYFIYFPVADLNHKEYRRRFYSDNADNRQWWTGLHETLSRSIKLTVCAPSLEATAQPSYRP